MLAEALATRRLRGATAVVSEAEDGTVTIRVNGHALAAQLYPKDHAYLEGVFDWIAAGQQARGAARLANPKITKRQKQRIRTGSPLCFPAPPPG
jgi:hypothetical protein